MQQVKTYTSGMFKGEARNQLAKDVKKWQRMAGMFTRSLMEEWGQAKHIQAD